MARSWRNRKAESQVSKWRNKKLRHEVLEDRCLLSADPIITEFMSSNKGYLLDGNGESPDWIEIFNNGDQSIDLAGYQLTDDSSELNKWLFPSTILESGQYLVVFASGNDGLDSKGNLHTNFSLDPDGEYLALANPTGTVLTEFGSSVTDYPEQDPNVTYGLAFNTTESMVVTPDSVASYHLPVDNSIDAVWTSPAFVDTPWMSGTASLGYEDSPGNYNDLIQTTIATDTTSVYVRIPFNISDSDAMLDRLNIKYDDGFIAYVNGVQVASSNAPENAAYDSLATAFHVHEAAIEYTSYDVHAYSDVLVLGENILAIHLMNASADEDMLLVPELSVVVGSVATPAVVGQLTSPSPYLPNSEALAGDISFSRVGGVITSPLLLNIASSEAGDSIRYTIDGSPPTLSSPLFVTDILIDASTQVRARAFGLNGRIGRVTSEAFTLVEPSLSNFTSDLPVVVIENFSQGIPERDFEDAFIAIYDTDANSGLSGFSNPPEVTSKIGQHRRGASTYSQPKSNLRIELRDEAGNDKDLSLLGMPAESDWILYAPYTVDRTMMRNAVMYDFSQQMGNYAIRTRYVEVFSNTDGGSLDESDYMGVYVLMENIKIDENRVDIGKLNSEEVAGGYIIKFDRNDGAEDASWRTSRNTPRASYLVHTSPERSALTNDQVDYIRDYLEDFEDALYGPNWKDPDLGYAAYIDIDAWVDHFLLRSFSKEKDILLLSEHFVKPQDGKLSFLPAWDFDRSSGYKGHTSSGTFGPTGWSWRGAPSKLWVREWWQQVFKDPDFVQAYIDRWQELRTSVFSDDNLNDTLNVHSSQIAQAQGRNYDRWPESTPSGHELSNPGLTGWEAEVSHFNNWLIDRAEWIDTRMTTPPMVSPEAGNVTVGTQVTLIEGEPGVPIYYTLDGSDPRNSGGSLSANAILYSGPITITETTLLQSRAYDSSVSWPWSQIESGLFSVNSPANSTNLRITELHYNPADPNAAEVTAGFSNNDEFEFIELLNTSGGPIELQGVVLSDAVNFTFSNSTVLAPGERVVLVENQAAFEERYGTVIRAVGQWTGGFKNSGETVTLTDQASQPIQSFTYEDGNGPGEEDWPTTPDGDGPSLVVLDTAGNYDDGTNWQASTIVGGTPGSDDESPIPGDYNMDGIVNDTDYTLWVSTFGSTVDLRADGNGNQVVDAADYTIWRDHLGQSIAAPVTTSVLATVSAASTNPLPPAERLEVEESPLAIISFAETAQSNSLPPVSTEIATQEESDLPLVTDLALRELSEQELSNRYAFRFAELPRIKGGLRTGMLTGRQFEGSTVGKQRWVFPLDYKTPVALMADKDDKMLAEAVSGNEVDLNVRLTWGKQLREGIIDLFEKIGKRNAPKDNE